MPNQADRTEPRPLIACSASDLVAVAKRATEVDPVDVDALLLCWDELESRSRKNRLARDEIIKLMSNVRLGAPGTADHAHRVGKGPWTLRPVPWYGAARRAALSLGPNIRRPRGVRHHVYVALIGGFSNGALGVYVGETSRKPTVRLQQHLNGVHGAGIVRLRGICLLPSLYAHLNPVPRATGKEIEAELCNALKRAFRDAGISDDHVRGGH